MQLGLEPFLPSLFLFVALTVALPLFPRTNMPIRRALVVVAIGLHVRYLIWRFTSSIPPVDDPVDLGFALLFLALELMLTFSTYMCFFTFWRYRDNTPLADQGERRLRAAGNAVPAVDVFIPTYNEKWEVLERTIYGAMALDYPNFAVWVLDDTRRDWLRDKCAGLGVRYATRATNEGAKAGNLNNGLAVSARSTNAPFVMVLDADFVPRRNFLYRVLGLLEDPKVAMVQTPQFFFNPNMVQHNLSITKQWMDEQRFFFDILQPAKDGWDVAFCCGTSCVARRSALDEVGGYPTDCVTEDIMVSYKLMSAGYVTRYLNEKLSAGLAPESTAEYIRQRMRWALGTIQSLYSPHGPFGPNNLSLFQRLMYFESSNYWLGLSSFWIFCMLAPVLYWYLGISIFDARAEDYVSHFLPAFIASSATFIWVSGGRLIPLFSDITEVVSASRVAPVVWIGVLTRRFRPFHVTAKAAHLDRIVINWPIFLEAGSVALLTALAVFGYRERTWRLPVEYGDPTLFTFWSCWNVLLLVLVAALAIERPRLRRQERFAIDEPATLRIDGQAEPCRVDDLSMLGASVRLSAPPSAALFDRPATLEMADVPPIPAQIVNAGTGGVRLRFDEARVPRFEIIRKLYTGNYESVAQQAGFGAALRAFVRQVVH